MGDHAVALADTMKSIAETFEKWGIGNPWEAEVSKKNVYGSCAGALTNGQKTDPQAQLIYNLRGKTATGRGEAWVRQG